MIRESLAEDMNVRGKLKEVGVPGVHQSNRRESAASHSRDVFGMFKEQQRRPVLLSGDCVGYETREVVGVQSMSGRRKGLAFTQSEMGKHWGI